jgi:hypothetical protein
VAPAAGEPAAGSGGKASLGQLNAFTEALEPGRWLQVPTSRMPLVNRIALATYQRRFKSAPLAGEMGAAAVIRAGNGAAFDGSRLFFWGGGGTAYGGNEWYEFDLETLAWKRHGFPSPLIGENRSVDPGGRCPVPYGGMASARTGDGVVWNPETRSIWVFATESFCHRGRLRPRPLLWEFDPAITAWRSTPLSGAPPADARTAWDPTRRRVVAMAGRAGAGEWFDIDERGRSARQPLDGIVTGAGMMEFDPDRRHFVVVGERDGRRGIFAWRPGSGPAPAPKLLTLIPDELEATGGTVFGMAYHPPSRRFVLWPGGREVWTWDPASNVFARHDNAAGAAPSSDHRNGVFSKWAYAAAADVFVGLNNTEEGVWLYRPPSGGGVAVDPAATVACVGSGADQRCFTRFAAALETASDGAVVTVRAGRWGGGGTVRADRVTVRGEVGAVLHTRTADGRAAIVVEGDDAVIENLRCYGIVVDSEDGACVRMEGRNITLRHLHVHDSDQGIVGGRGRVLVEDSLFERLGRAGRSHAIHVGGRAEELIVRRSRVLASKEEGHGVRSRAPQTIIEGSAIASLDGRDGRLIDAPNGGQVIVRSSILQEGPFSVDLDLVGIGLERGADPAADHPEVSFLMKETTVILEGVLRSRILSIVGETSPPTFVDNVFVGSASVQAPGNRWYIDRFAAGLPPYPALTRANPPDLSKDRSP